MKKAIVLFGMMVTILFCSCSKNITYELDGTGYTYHLEQEIDIEEINTYVFVKQSLLEYWAPDYQVFEYYEGAEMQSEGFDEWIFEMCVFSLFAEHSREYINKDKSEMEKDFYYQYIVKMAMDQNNKSLKKQVAENVGLERDLILSSYTQGNDYTYDETLEGVLHKISKDLDIPFEKTVDEYFVPIDTIIWEYFALMKWYVKEETSVDWEEVPYDEYGYYCEKGFNEFNAWLDDMLENTTFVYE